MFADWLSKERLSWYVTSPHKNRIDHVGKCLLDQRYVPSVVRRYLQEWMRFAHHLDEYKVPFPSSFHASEVQEYMLIRFPGGNASRIRCIRAAIRILIETEEDGRFPRRIRALPGQTNALYQEAVHPYLDFLRQHRGFSKKTVRTQAFQLAMFTDFLEAVGVNDWENLGASALREFLSTQLTERKPRTRRSYASTLRSFLSWGYRQEIFKRDLSAAAPTVRQYRLAGLPDVLSEGEVKSLLASVDRSTPIGRRDYAVLLLAARYGMRPSDIRQLSLNHIDWRERRIVMQQSKTRRVLALPLLDDVAEALIAYLRHGRPETKARNLFVRHRAPFEPFGPNSNLQYIVRNVLRRMGMGERVGLKGLYLFRHTLATRMLSRGNSIKTISDVLGHTCLDSTLVYTKVDLLALRSVAISLKEVLE